eukprot:Awhi_evm1s10426
MSSDPELEAIRAKRMAELQGQNGNQQQQQQMERQRQQQQQQQEMKDTMISRLLDQNARAR